jgi:tungstate transport system substrate-binding protein
MFRRKFLTIAAALSVSAGLALMANAPATAADNFIVVQSTTSTQNSGLFDFILPMFSKKTGIDVRVVAVGTGQALKNARNGDGDVLLVHAKPAEEKFVADGFGMQRKPVMYNDFVLIGPKADPAGVAGRDIAVGLARLAAAGAPFVSRGDKSGTHAAELRYWKLVGIDMATLPKGYLACGCGMGPALNIAASSNAYVLADRGTWLSFRNRADLGIVVEGDTRLFNPYGVIVINPARHPHVKVALAQRFADWIVSAAGQEAIAAYRIDGQQLFFPNADR